MRLAASGGRTLLLGYCANVHPGESLADVLAVPSRYAGPVRRALGWEQLGLGLWLSRAALSELRREGVHRLRNALERESLFVATLNGFPYGNFQAAVVKRAVYHPDLGTMERASYLLELAEVLAEIMPDDAAEGTISTLPLGHRDEAAPDLYDRSLARLCWLATELRRLRDRTGRRVRICLEPEPGCLLETTEDAVELFTERLPEAARRSVTPADAIAEHLGLCFDTCHQAVAFEEAATSLATLARAGITVGKMQLSSALVVPEPASLAAEALLTRFDEPRFLHQVRARLDDRRLAAADDLPLAGALPRDRPWRIHFHVPIHRAIVGDVSTTRDFLEQALDNVARSETAPHLEVETYTWSVLPPGERPHDDASLVQGIADELAWVRARLG
jgi:hypothetical protein